MAAHYRYNAEMPVKRRRKRRRSYAWALRLRDDDPEVQALHEDAWLGLGYARRLGEDALERRRYALSEDAMPLTAHEIAKELWLSPVEVSVRIREARLLLFGDRGERAIFNELKRIESRRGQPRRRCAAPRCSKEFPLHATARRRYCRGSRCRVAALRARRRSASPQFEPHAAT